MKSILLLAFIVATANTIMGQEDDCQDVPNIKCTENKAAGKCDWKWMKNQCKDTCGLCPGPGKLGSIQELAAVMANQIRKGIEKLTEAEGAAKAIGSNLSTFWQPKDPTAAEKGSMREDVAVLNITYGQAQEELNYVQMYVDRFAGDDLGAYWS